MAEEVKKDKEEGGAPKWMTTFADLMSLLMCFFVLLLSFSEMDRQKFKQVAGSMEKAFGVQKDVPVKDSIRGMEMVSPEFSTIPLQVQVTVMENLAEEIEEEIVETEFTPEGLIIRVEGGVAFDSGKAEIKDRFKTLLDNLGKSIAGQDVKMIVSGHTDNVPLMKDAEFSSNWSLSAVRAVKVLEYLADRFKFSPQKLSAAGFADGEPVADNATEKGRAKNRRVEFKIKPLKKGIVFNGIQSIEE